METFIFNEDVQESKGYRDNGFERKFQDQDVTSVLMSKSKSLTAFIILS